MATPSSEADGRETLIASRGEKDHTERTDLICVELDFSPERLMCAGLIGK